ncbi:MAG: DUF732 domain-containing protein [Mycobacterium sp.]
MMRVNIAALSVALLVAMTMAAATAHAEHPDQAFLHDLDSQGIVVQHAAELQVGYHACEEMHSGASLDAAANTNWWPTLVRDGSLRRIVEAAQRHLCPDTMH